MKTMLNNLYKEREELLHEFILASGSDRGEILTQILEIDEQIEQEQTRLNLV